MPRVIHAADVHIDSPLSGFREYKYRFEERLDSSSASPTTVIPQQFALATRQAFANLIDLCIAEKAALLLLAGDLFHAEWKEYNTGLFVVHQLARLQAVGTQVALIRGNHDAASVLTKGLPYPNYVHEFDSRSASTCSYDDLGIAVHGQSFSDRNVSDNLALRFPKRVSDFLNIGLLHTNAAGARGSEEHERYAPCHVQDLLDRGYDYWALGHVHTCQTLHPTKDNREENEGGPIIAYSGATQGRHIRETGPKGCLLLDVEPGRGVIESQFVALDTVRWARVTVNLDETVKSDQAAFEVAARAMEKARREAAAEPGDPRPLLCRVEFTGRASERVLGKLAADPERTQARVAADAALIADDLWIEKTQLSLVRPVSGDRSKHFPPAVERSNSTPAGPDAIANIEESAPILDFAAALAQEFDRLAGLSDNDLLAYLPDLQRLHLATARAELEPTANDANHIRSILGSAEAVLLDDLLPSDEAEHGAVSAPFQI